MSTIRTQASSKKEPQRRSRAIKYLQAYTSTESPAFKQRISDLYHTILAFLKKGNDARWALCCHTFDRLQKAKLGHDNTIQVSELVRQHGVRTEKDLEDYLTRVLPRNSQGEILMPQCNMQHSQSEPVETQPTCLDILDHTFDTEPNYAPQQPDHLDRLIIELREELEQSKETGEDLLNKNRDLEAQNNLLKAEIELKKTIIREVQGKLKDKQRECELIKSSEASLKVDNQFFLDQIKMLLSNKMGQQLVEPNHIQVYNQPNSFRLDHGHRLREPVSITLTPNAAQVSSKISQLVMSLRKRPPEHQLK